jgi:hypothetical protein
MHPLPIIDTCSSISIIPSIYSNPLGAFYMKHKVFTLRAAAVLTLVILLAALPLSSALAIPAGPRNAGTGANVAGVGSVAWTNPGNITTVGSPYATANVGSGATSNYLRGTNYGFNIPDGSTINGITVVINRQSTGTLSPFISDNVVRLVRGGTIVGTNMATAANWPTSSLATATYGNSGELWGIPWTPTDINNSNFGVVLSVNNLNGFSSRTATVDYMQITVEYTLPGTTTTVNCGSGTPSVDFGESLTCVATVTRLAGGNTPAGTVSWVTGGAGTFTTSPCTLSGSGASASCSVTYRPTAIGTGSHLITANYSGNVNFAASSDSRTVTVNPRPVTVTADPQTKVYYDPDPTLTYQVTSGSLLPGDVFSGALSRVAGEDVGPYAIQQGTLALNANYTITFVSANLTITPFTLTVTADPQTKVYGNDDPELTYQYDESLLAPGDEFSGALIRAAGEDVDTYAILQGTLTLGDNYIIDFVSDDLTITPRPITVTANAQTKVYGTADPNLTYQVTTGTLVPGDVLTGALTRVPGEAVGPYAIQRGTLNNPNYTISFAPANLTITSRPLGITADAQTKVYGALDPTLSYQVTSGSLAFTDTFTGTLTRLAGEIVGTYAIQQGTLAVNPNYTLGFTGALLTVTPRPLTVTADAQTKVYGAVDPALTYQVTSGSLAFTDTFTGALTRDAGEALGPYAIRQGTLALNANYTLSYVGANLAITPRLVTVTANAQTKVYGEVDPNLTYSVTSGTLLAGDVFTGALTREAGEAVDSYQIQQGTLALPAYYTLTYVDANLTVTSRPVTVTADAKTKKFGAADPALTYRVTSGTLLTGDAFTGALVREPGEAVDTYAIQRGTLSLPGYYTLTYVGANFTITSAGPALTLIKTAAPLIFVKAGDVINYTYVMTNTGDVALVAPFTVTDDKAVTSCPSAATLAVSASLTCTGSYTILQADVAAGFVTNIATASAVYAGSPVVSNSAQTTVSSRRIFLPLIIK